MKASDPNKIHATPTKDFFTYTLVRDIELSRVVLDLVDNCVDGAKRIRRGDNFTGLWVHIEARPDKFSIADNCGGIPVDIARYYAFRFGRPEGAPTTRHSVGHFGVGMKRAVFKMGRKFRVESTTAKSRFVVVENVDDWKKKDEWEFRFEELDEKLTKSPSVDQQGTIITVEALYDNVSADFGVENFLTRLKTELEAAHAYSIERGLSITLNDNPLKARSAELLQSDRIRPAYRDRVSKERGRESVTVKVYVGIADSKPSSAPGWYVFCNGRMVLEADRTRTTGWGEGGETKIPHYHPQYARFRGYVFFDSDDAGLLPWNTPKTGVDADSPRFKSVRLEMVTLMRPVIDFLNRLDSEKDLEERPLEDAIEKAKMVKLSEIRKSTTFVAPKSLLRAKSDLGRIQYSKPWDEIERAKDALKVSTLKEVGEKTFEYFYRMECED